MRRAGPAKVYTLSARLPFDQILSQSSDLILVLDETYTVRNVSDSLLLAFGISKDYIENLDVNTTFIGPGLIDRIRDPVREGLAGTESVVNAWIPVQKVGRAFRIRIIPLVFGWGDKGVVIMLEDRTGEIMSQEENALLADLVNDSPAAITVLDFSGNYFYSNQMNLDLHGFSAGEFLKMNISDLDIPDSKEGIEERMKELKRTGELTFEVTHFHKDGHQIPLEVRAKVATWGDREVIISIATDTSERKQAERALRESERRSADIISFLPDATFVVNSEGTVIAWNRAIEELTGVNARDIVGQGDYVYANALYGERRPILLDLIFHDEPEVRKYYRHLRKEGSTFTAETILPHPGAEERTVWLKASPFYDKDGRITGAIESIRDITERKEAEEALIKSKERFNQVAENTGEWIWEVDEKGVYTYCSSAVENIIGYSADELVGRIHHYDLFAPDMRETLTETTLAAFQRKDPFRNFVNPKIHKNGSTIILETSGSPVFDEQGTLLGYRGADLDVTERTNAENALKESEAKFRALVENSLDGILITDFAGTLLFANQAAGLIVDSVDYQAVIGVRNMLEFVAPESQAGVLRDLSQVSQGIDAYLVRHKLITEAKREIWVECIGKKIPFGGSTAMLVSMRDITERKQVDEELRESESKFTTVFRSSPVALTLVSATNGTFVDVNDTFLRNTGYTREDVIGKPFEELGIFADNNQYTQIVSLLRNQRHVQGMELRCRIKTGEIRTCRFSSGIIMIGDNPYILSTVEDITERKQAESAFQAMVTSMVGTTGMESLDRITESISAWLGADCIMIGEITPDRKRVHVVSMLLDGKKIPDYSYTLKGTPCENTAEKGFCLYPDEAQKLFPQSSDLRTFNIRGYAGTPLCNSEGQVMGVLCIMTREPLVLPPSARDIIDIISVKAAAEIRLRKALEALHESERKFRTIFENSPYPIAINSYPDNKFIEVNAAFLTTSGYTETEILGKNPVELGLFSLTDSARLVGRMAIAGRLENVPLAMTGKGSRRVHVQFSAIPVTINDRRAIVTVAAEVTKLKRVEEELHQQNLVLETINQLALEFASLPRGKSVPEQAVKKLAKLSGAVVTLFSLYDPADRMLQVTNYDIAPGMLGKIIRLLGKQPGDVKSPVNTDVYQEMVSAITGKRKTLTEASFGQIPPLVSMSIQKLMNIDRFIGVAYVIEGKLYGTSLLGMKPGQPDPSTELLESFAHIVAISLRRDRDEPGP